jgi:hypothetical protein
MRVIQVQPAGVLTIDNIVVFQRPCPAVTVTRSNDPEQIDLIDLVLQLWRGKWLIGAFIAIAILIAGAYLMVAKEQWSKPMAALLSTRACWPTAARRRTTTIRCMGKCPVRQWMTPGWSWRAIA